MSNYAPGWYPDGSGRYAQRYYDGTSWTEFVLDASGRQTTDHVPGVTPVRAQPERWGQPSPASAATPSDPYRPPAAQSGQPGTQSQGWGRPPAPDPSVSPPQYGSYQFGGAPSTASAYGRPSEPAAVASAAPSGVRVTTGLIAAAVGALLVVLGALALDYWSADGASASLGDIADAGDGAGINGLVTAYAGFGRWLGLLAVAAILAVAVLRAIGHATIARASALALIVAIVGGLFALWHLVGLFLTPDVGGPDIGPSVAGFAGVLGYVASGVSGYLTQRLGPSR